MNWRYEYEVSEPPGLLVPQANVQPKGVVLKVPEPQVPPEAPELLAAPELLELVLEPLLLDAPLLELLEWEPLLLELVLGEPLLLDPPLLELLVADPLLLEPPLEEPPPVDPPLLVVPLPLLAEAPLLLEAVAPELLLLGRLLASTGVWRSCPHAAPRTTAPSARSRGANRFMGRALRLQRYAGIRRTTERRCPHRAGSVVNRVTCTRTA